MPVYIFLSPNLPIDENHNLVNQTGQGAIVADALNDLTPPQYGEHQFDQLYSEIDTSGYATPGGPMSGFNTPMQARSRSVSGDNITTIEAMRSSEFPINALQNRLNNLEGHLPRDRSNLSASLETDHDSPSAPVENVDNRDQHATNVSSDPPDLREPADQGRGNSLSRSASEDSAEGASAAQSPSHVEFTAEDLAKVPSYTTALRSNPRMLSSGLPTYQSATGVALSSPPIRYCAQAVRQFSGRGSI